MANVLKVSAKSNPNLVAGALAGSIRESGEGELQAIGAGAVNQAVKSAAIACSYLQPAEIELLFKPEFTEVDVEGEKRTAIRLKAVVKGK